MSGITPLAMMGPRYLFDPPPNEDGRPRPFDISEHVKNLAAPKTHPKPWERFFRPDNSVSLPRWRGKGKWQRSDALPKTVWNTDIDEVPYKHARTDVVAAGEAPWDHRFLDGETTYDNGAWLLMQAQAAISLELEEVVRSELNIDRQYDLTTILGLGKVSNTTVTGKHSQHVDVPYQIAGRQALWTRCIWPMKARSILRTPRRSASIKKILSFKSGIEIHELSPNPKHSPKLYSKRERLLKIKHLADKRRAGSNSPPTSFPCTVRALSRRAKSEDPDSQPGTPTRRLSSTPNAGSTSKTMTSNASSIPSRAQPRLGCYTPHSLGRSWDDGSPKISEKIRMMGAGSTPMKPPAGFAHLFAEEIIPETPSPGKRVSTGTNQETKVPESPTFEFQSNVPTKAYPVNHVASPPAVTPHKRLMKRPDLTDDVSPAKTASTVSFGSSHVTTPHQGLTNGLKLPRAKFFPSKSPNAARDSEVQATISRALPNPFSAPVAGAISPSAEVSPTMSDDTDDIFAPSSPVIEDAVMMALSRALAAAAAAKEMEPETTLALATSSAVSPVVALTPVQEIFVDGTQSITADAASTASSPSVANVISTSTASESAVDGATAVSSQIHADATPSASSQAIASGPATPVYESTANQDSFAADAAIDITPPRAFTNDTSQLVGDIVFPTQNETSMALESRPVHNSMVSEENAQAGATTFASTPQAAMKDSMSQLFAGSSLRIQNLTSAAFELTPVYKSIITINQEKAIGLETEPPLPADEDARHETAADINYILSSPGQEMTVGSLEFEADASAICASTPRAVFDTGLANNPVEHDSTMSALIGDSPTSVLTTESLTNQDRPMKSLWSVTSKPKRSAPIPHNGVSTSTFIKAPSQICCIGDDGTVDSTNIQFPTETLGQGMAQWQGTSFNAADKSDSPSLTRRDRSKSVSPSRENKQQSGASLNDASLLDAAQRSAMEMNLAVNKDIFGQASWALHLGIKTLAQTDANKTEVAATIPAHEISATSESGTESVTPIDDSSSPQSAGEVINHHVASPSSESSMQSPTLVLAQSRSARFGMTLDNHITFSLDSLRRQVNKQLPTASLSASPSTALKAFGYNCDDFSESEPSAQEKEKGEGQIGAAEDDMDDSFTTLPTTLRGLGPHQIPILHAEEFRVYSPFSQALYRSMDHVSYDDALDVVEEVTERSILVSPADAPAQQELKNSSMMDVNSVVPAAQDGAASRINEATKVRDGIKTANVGGLLGEKKGAVVPATAPAPNEQTAASDEDKDFLRAFVDRQDEVRATAGRHSISTISEAGSPSASSSLSPRRVALGAMDANGPGPAKRLKLEEISGAIVTGTDVKDEGAPASPPKRRRTTRVVLKLTAPSANAAVLSQTPVRLSPAPAAAAAPPKRRIARSEADALAALTRANTATNKGVSVTPKAVLARQKRQNLEKKAVEAEVALRMLRPRKVHFEELNEEKPPAPVSARRARAPRAQKSLATTPAAPVRRSSRLQAPTSVAAPVAAPSAAHTVSATKGGKGKKTTAAPKPRATVGGRVTKKAAPKKAAVAKKRKAES